MPTRTTTAATRTSAKSQCLRSSGPARATDAVVTIVDRRTAGAGPQHTISPASGMTDDETSDTEAPGEPQAAETPFGNFRRRTLETFASLLFGTLVAGLYAILTARALGPSGKGLVTVLLLLPALAALVLSGPIELANQYFGARQPETRHRLLTNSLV